MKNTLGLFVVLFFGAFAGTCCAADAVVTVPPAMESEIPIQSFTVTGKKPSANIVVEQDKGAPRTWELVGYSSAGYVRYAMLSDGSSELRKIEVDAFAILPKLHGKFKLAKFNGKGGFVPVDLKEVDGELFWALVVE